MGAARIIQGVLVGAALVVLIGAAAIVGQGSDLAADAEALVLSFYESGDPQLVIDHIVPGSVPVDPQTTAAIEQGLAELLAQPVEVASTEVVAPFGHQLAIVEMSGGGPAGEGFRWCVDEAAGVLLSCVIGEVTVEATVEGAPLAVARATVLPFADEAQLVLILVPEGQNARPYRLEVEPTLTAADGSASPFELDQALYVTAEGQGEPADGPPYVLRPDRALAFDYRAHDLSDRAAFESQSQLTWDDGSVQVSVTSATWYLE